MNIKLSQKQIGQRLTSLRKMKGFSQEDLAKSVKISRKRQPTNGWRQPFQDYANQPSDLRLLSRLLPLSTATRKTAPYAGL